ncbi:DEAD/DEAH box helicase [Cognatazoarcus halotolerans]|uniref:DEAD/DEAH box helicase n=1 Tax=Cognatazoarcus halotolerans TaxID=2686016 RepID=UPI001357A92A|nr:SNF2-related protein [Cognatazoarcus halotolerans]
MSFVELTGLKRRYAGQAGTLVREFFIPVLSRAVRYDRQTGYFDSASLVQMAEGLAGLIQNAKPSSKEPPIRIIAGATWTEADVDAYRRGKAPLAESLGTSLLDRFAPSDDECVRLGLPKGWKPEADQIARHRLGTLAWLVASGMLEVRVALPLDPSGRPYLPGRQGALYHPKSGVLYDGEGQRILFQGSINETGAAWARNREKFDVKRSWFSAQDVEDIDAEEQEFKVIWDGDDPQLLVLPLPKAVKERLLDFTPSDGPPNRDALEPAALIPSEEDRVTARRYLEAPRRPENAHLVLSPLWSDGAHFRPFPHQDRVYRRASEEYPRSFLFCDEVGLGKTIEGGLALRRLLLRGQVSRILLIVPRSLVRQWMEELREKLALTGWFYDGRALHDVAGRRREVASALAEPGIIVTSRHLIARSDRRAEVLAAPPWDLVIVDEAHAARRSGLDDAPNQLLSLLQDIRRRQLSPTLWLLTATPMQLDPIEVFDLLRLCGLEGQAWGDWVQPSGFQQFFEDLRTFGNRPPMRQNVVRMAGIAVRQGAPALNETAPPRQHWSGFQWENFVRSVNQSTAEFATRLAIRLSQLNALQAEALIPFLARQTPLGVLMFRHTRSTLRAYQAVGMVSKLAYRRPEDVPVDFASAEEEHLYLRIDEMCRQFYRLADFPPDERSGVGFLMAVFRKRLASSFHAFRLSLERRRDLIRAIQDKLSEYDITAIQHQLVSAESEEEDEAAEVEAAFDRERQRLTRLYGDPTRRQSLDEERKYLDDYIRALNRWNSDSKFQRFDETLRALVAGGHRVIVFTQYLDTLDFIRDRLVARFGDRMACYSGRGGEVWDASANTWKLVDKAEIKARSKRDHDRAIHVLLGTDAASEGLNLQQFSALVNYDLPWNPMRVEQRIGRIDRIGQESETVGIYNLYFRGTIEEDTYFTLKVRIRIFEEVVGPLQPILAEMPRIMSKVARGEMEQNEAQQLLDEATRRTAGSGMQPLEAFTQTMAIDQSDQPQAGSVSQEELAAWCLTHVPPGMSIMAIPEPGSQTTESDGRRACFRLTWQGAPAPLGILDDEELLVTFNGELADRHPPTAKSADDEEEITATSGEGVRLLTWGDPLLVSWLEAFAGTNCDESNEHTGATGT